MGETEGLAAVAQCWLALAPWPIFPAKTSRRQVRHGTREDGRAMTAVYGGTGESTTDAFVGNKACESNNTRGSSTQHNFVGKSFVLPPYVYTKYYSRGFSLLCPWRPLAADMPFVFELGYLSYS